MIKFLFFLIVFFFVIRLLSRFFLLYILRKINNRGNIKKDKEGDVSINKVPKKTKNKSDKVGDYVDYEEID